MDTPVDPCEVDSARMPTAEREHAAAIAAIVEIRGLAGGTRGQVTVVTA